MTAQVPCLKRFLARGDFWKGCRTSKSWNYIEGHGSLGVGLEASFFDSVLLLVYSLLSDCGYIVTRATCFCYKQLVAFSQTINQSKYFLP